MTRPARRPLAVALAISLVLVVATVSVYLLVFRGPREVLDAGGENLAKVIREGGGAIEKLASALQFHPKVTIGGETVYTPAVEATELVTASKDFQHSYSYEASWAGSTKRLELKGEFTAKAGFLVDGSLRLDVSPDGRKVTVHHTAPRLLACELRSIQVVRDEDGWWNKLQADEREAAQNELLRRARQRAMDADLSATATRNLLERLRPLQADFSFTTESQTIP